jgi:predicted acetylornithine/succinylornithine family transaminase
VATKLDARSTEAAKLTGPQVIEAYDRYVIQTYGRIPLVFARGEGAYLWDSEGKRYLDFVSGGRAGTGLGHRHPAVVAALREQLERVMFISNDFYHPWGAQLARMLSERSGGRKIFFCNSGAEASETAIKLARKWGSLNKGPGPHAIITADRGFHGRTMGALSATAQTKFHKGFEPVLSGFRYVPFNDIAALRAAIGPETCAVYLEPVQGESGIYPADREYLPQVAELCRKERILFMVDEVQTGFGRTGKYWAYEHYGVEPDVVTTAKALAGGLPIGACLAKPDAAVLQPGDHGCTFGGNPFSCAGAIAALSALDEHGYVENAARQGEHLLKGLREHQRGSKSVADVRGLGLMIAIELGVPEARAVFDRCLEAGLVINPVGDTILRLLPPVIITASQADEALGILKKALG